MQISIWSLELVLFIFPTLFALLLFRWFAINSYKRKRADTLPRGDSWLSSMGQKIADSRSFKFTIIHTALLIAVTIITLGYSASIWNHTLYFGIDSITPIGVLPAFPIIAIFLCSGLLYVTMTSQGLSWWDARVILFRFYAFHYRRSYMKDQICSLIEEIDAGIDDPYRAFLTLQRLFGHEFKAGEVAREIVEKQDSTMYQELESAIVEGGKPRRASNLILASSIIFLLLSIIFPTLGIFVYSAVTHTDILSDTLFTLFFVFFLIWMIRFSLELPELTQDSYKMLKLAAIATNDGPSRN